MRNNVGLEKAVWERIAALDMSPSHDFHHLNRVKYFALKLQGIHGGDIDVLIAATLLHDLGRADEGRAHGKASIEASVDEAEKVLHRLGSLTEAQKDKALNAIAEHDQPEMSPATIEGKILKDADFLAGFGAWGILRIAMWSGETGRDMDTLLDRIENGMRRRANSLEFPESIRIARRELSFTRLFLRLLDDNPNVYPEDDFGHYIVLEGISGSGKDTQAAFLTKKLEAQGKEATVVGEPNTFYKICSKALRTSLEGELPDYVRRWLFVADREHLMNTKVQPALRAGNVVLSVRSFISTLVHQCEEGIDTATLGFAHRFVPPPDVVVLMDLEPEEAMSRIDKRGEAKGTYETIKHLRVHRDRYKEVCSMYFPDQTVVIDASKSKDEVHADIWTTIQHKLWPHLED